MKIADVISAVFLALGVLSFVATALGLLVDRDVYNRVQYTYPGSTVGVVSIVAALLVHEGFSQAGIKSILIGLILFWTNPILSHATARAARIRRKNQWPPAPDEQIPVAEENQRK
jgi:multicomponent Na+:H+ antiporter subunit G